MAPEPETINLEWKITLRHSATIGIASKLRNVFFQTLKSPAQSPTFHSAYNASFFSPGPRPPFPPPPPLPFLTYLRQR